MNSFKRKSKRRLRNTRGRSLLVESLESRRLLAVYQVTTAADVIDANDGVISMREAVTAANANAGQDTIQFSPALDGVPIQITSSDTKTLNVFDELVENRVNAVGDFDVFEDLIIQGRGMNKTILDGNEMARVFHIGTDVFAGNFGPRPPVDVQIADLTIRNGWTDTIGGGIRSHDGDLILSSVRVADNTIETAAEIVFDDFSNGETIFAVRPARGGGVFKDGVGTLTVTNSLIKSNVLTGGNGVDEFESTLGQFHNSTLGGSGQGGGIFAQTSDVSITGTRIQSNRITAGEGGLSQSGPGKDGKAGGSAQGAGVYVSLAGLDLQQSSVTQNFAGGGTGGIGRNTNLFSEMVFHPTGDAGDGGAGGSALGAGVYFDSANGQQDLDVTASTVSHNFLLGGFGGDGGFAGFHPPNPIDNSEAPLSNNGFDGGDGGRGGAAQGAGIFIATTNASPNDAVLLSTTIAENTAAYTLPGQGGLGGIDGEDGAVGAQFMSAGGGVYSPAVGVNASATIIGDNRAAVNEDFVGTFITPQYVLLEDASGAVGITPAGGNLLGVDPGLAPITSAGSLTFYHPTLLTSRAINASAVGSSVDQVGTARPVGQFDIGAYEQQAVSTVFVVNSTADDRDSNLNDGIAMTATGEVTLRAAIEQANALSDSDSLPILVHFDIPGAGAHQINVGSMLPGLQHVTVDATTQPGYNGTPLVQINGNDTVGVGLRNGHKIAGLSVTGFTKFGIDLVSGATLVSQNYVGLTPSGQVGANRIGVRAFSNVSSTSRSDEPDYIYDNVVSGNTVFGINDRSSGSVIVQSNFVGTSPDGQTPIPNGVDGVNFNAPRSLSYLIQKRVSDNVVSGNGRWGIAFIGNDFEATVQRNKIGTNVDGTSAVPNAYGFFIDNARVVVQDNLISGNQAVGLLVDYSRNQIIGNIIGLNLAADAALPNGQSGLQITARSQIIGGPNPGDGNVISGNGLHGVLFQNADSSLVQGNVIGASGDGQSAIGNGGDGVRLAINSGYNEIIDNQISGNTLRAVATDHLNSSHNQIVNNLIGTNADGTLPLNNGPGGALRLLSGSTHVEGNVISSPDIGILAFRDADNTSIVGNWIGTNSDGTAVLPTPTGVRLIGANFKSEVESNVFANNTQPISIENGAGPVSARLNQFLTASAVPVDLGGDGATANDLYDLDSGANNLQNSPELIEALSVSDQIQLTYHVDSLRAASSYWLTVDFYLVAADGSISTLLGTDIYSGADARKQKVVSFQPVSVNVGDQVIAQVTDMVGNSSEFGIPLAITA